MILYPPVQFDGNEWFIILAAILNFMILFRLPRTFKVIEIVIIWIFNYFLAEFADFSIAVPPLDFYDFNDWPEYEYFDLVLYVFIYPPAAYLMLYYYHKWKLRGWPLAVYILMWAFITTGLEGAAAIFHVFTYKKWKLIYSFPAYVLIYGLNILVFRFVSKQLEKPTEAQGEV